MGRNQAVQCSTPLRHGTLSPAMLGCLTQPIIQIRAMRERARSRGSQAGEKQQTHVPTLRSADGWRGQFCTGSRRPCRATAGGEHSTGAQHRRRATAGGEHSTGAQHGNTARKESQHERRVHSTGAQHGGQHRRGDSVWPGRAAQEGSHGSTARKHNTGEQHGRRAHSTGGRAAQHGGQHRRGDSVSPPYKSCQR